MAQESSIREVLRRLIDRLDHRWKRDGELPEDANSYAFLRSMAEEIADPWEILAEIRRANELETLSGLPLAMEARDLGLERKPGWSDEDLRWWVILHYYLYRSQGTIPDIERIIAYRFKRDMAQASRLRYEQGMCEICGHEEPAFYTMFVPWDFLEADPAWLMFDPNDDDELHEGTVGVLDTATWGDWPEEAIREMLRWFDMATPVGVRINVQGTEGFQFDPSDDDVVRETSDHGFDNSFWNGAMREILEDYGLEAWWLQRFHSCVSVPTPWREYPAIYAQLTPDVAIFDPDDGDSLGYDYRRGVDYGIFGSEE